MIAHKPISKKIARVYMIGAAVLLFFYSIAFYFIVLQTEHVNSLRRLEFIAPFHFEKFTKALENKIEIDPLLTIYPSYNLLPETVKKQIAPSWTGSDTLILSDDTEISIHALVNTDKGVSRIFYAVENVELVEWNKVNYAVMQLTLFSLGFLLFFCAAAFIIKTANKITKPFTNLANRLEKESASEFETIENSGEQSLELVQTVSALNSYRVRIQDSIIREKSFTRYVSHELRTPMTVIKGHISMLFRINDSYVIKHVNKINDAVDDMEQLMKTFLLLARGQSFNEGPVEVNPMYLSQIESAMKYGMEKNEITFKLTLLKDFSLKAEPILLNAVIINLLSNAFNCSIGGRVNLFISAEQLDVVDDGVGLNEKPRGYDGFGIGLQLVEDICERYNWHFKISNNSEHGCTATVRF